MMRGTRVTLRATGEGDLADLMSLWNDGRVMKWVGFPDGLGYDTAKIHEWYGRIQSNSDRHHFVVHAEGIGFCGEAYCAVDRAHSRAGLDIKFRPEAQGQGLATDAQTTLIDLVFEAEPDVEAVWTEPSKENAAARRLYGRCGLAPRLRPSDMGDCPSYWERRRGEGGHRSS